MSVAPITNPVAGRPAPFRIALVGAPNCGKSTLFNGLTGGRAKVANFPGATVETRTGKFTTQSGHMVDLLDLPGFYGMSPRSRDEVIALDMVKGTDGAPPDLLLVLIDAANLRTHLHSVLQLKSFGIPLIISLNMIDLARRDGLKLDIGALERELGVPVVTSQATRKAGREAVIAKLDAILNEGLEQRAVPVEKPQPQPVKELQAEARAIIKKTVLAEPIFNQLTRKIDQVVLHPVAGPLILIGILLFMFQAVFAWASLPMDLIEAGISGLGSLIASTLPEGWLRSLIVDGIIAGVGSVLVFLPQIIILFAFILLLEASGYMARAAFMMDELMARVGLSGRAFIPLLSSFACAIPGIMAARVVENERDRLTTMLIAPLMTCSARLPVYTLIIAAFIPRQNIGFMNLQGIVMFALYMVGVVSAIIVAFVLKRTLTKGQPQPLMMELPSYKMPNARDFFIGLWVRISAFLKRAGTIILGTSIALWFLVSYPSSATALKDSFAGRIGSVLEVILAPIGFNLEIAIALVPGMAAREVAVGALGTVYAVQGGEENVEGLASVLQSAWSLPTALAFLAWYVFAPQCFATLATIRRESNSWKWTAFSFTYLIVLAYIAAGMTYHIARWAL